MDKAYQIQARWDSEAELWVAESEDVPGLVAEAESPNVLREKLRDLIFELLELNGVKEEGTGEVRLRWRYQNMDFASACAKVGTSARLIAVLSGVPGPAEDEESTREEVLQLGGALRKDPDPVQERLRTIPGVKLPVHWPPWFRRVEPLKVEGELVSERLVRERR